MIEAIIFDMDGLMVDTEPIQSKAFGNVIRAYGKEPMLNPNGLVHEVGVRGDKNFRAMKNFYGIEEDLEVLRKQRRAEYNKLLRKDGVRALPGLINLLEILSKEGLHIALASNSRREEIEFVLQYLQISKYFEVIVSGQDVVHGKPNPEIFIKTSNQLKISPEKCLVIEDGESGVNGAKQIGMKVIAVPSIYTKHHNMENADKVCSSLEDIDLNTIKTL